MKRLLYLIIALMLFSACEKVLDVDAGERLMVLNGVPSEGRRAFVNLSYTHFFLDTVNSQPVGGSSITLTVNGVSYDPDSVSGCNYFFPYTLQADDQLEISVDADGHHLEAQTYVPRPPAIDAMNIKVYESPSFNFYLARFNLADHAGYDDYYNLVVTMRDSEIAAIRRFEATQRKIHLHETAQLIKGAEVTILSGEFAGMTGRLVKDCKDGNFSVQISALNISFVVQVKRSELRPPVG